MEKQSTEELGHNCGADGVVEKRNQWVGWRETASTEPWRARRDRWAVREEGERREEKTVDRECKEMFPLPSESEPWLSVSDGIG